MAIAITNQIIEHPEQLSATMPAHVMAMVQRLVETFDPERVYLFGSQARGDNRPDSDYDFMVVVADSDQPQYRRSQIGYGALTEFAYSKDVLVWTHGEFYPQLQLKASFPSTIVREGVLLYGR